VKFLVISFVLLTWPFWGHCQNPEWVFQMGGVGAGNLSNIEPKFHVSPLDSSIYITGAFYGTDVLRFGDEMISDMTLTSGENGMFLLKLTQHGVLQWAKTSRVAEPTFSMMWPSTIMETSTWVVRQATRLPLRMH
jgi:hypothetical protein